MTPQRFLADVRRAMTVRCAGRLGALTVGVEQEFFLWNAAQGRCIDPGETAAFVAQMARLPGWTPAGTARDCGEQLRYPVDGRRYHALKVEHAPHLLEVATAPTDSVDELQHWLTTLFDSLDHAADAVGLRVLHVPSIAPESVPSSALVPTSPHPAQVAASRARLATEAGLAGDPLFTAYLAATQVSIGGFDWWSDSAVLEHLYSREIAIQRRIAAHAHRDDSAAVACLQMRADFYVRVFRGMEPLLFPRFSTSWLQAWAAAIVGQDQRYWSTEPAVVTDDQDVWAVWALRRDLQFIRPRPFGPLEFRGDPALPDVDAILFAVRERLAAVRESVQGAKDRGPADVRAAREAWLATVHPDLRPWLKQVADAHF